jgi:hypothetical protein
MTARHDPIAFAAAHSKFLHGEALTDSDLAELAIVDGRLASRAEGRRSGLGPPLQYPESYGNTPATMAAVAKAIEMVADMLGDAILPIVNAAKYRIAQLETRVAELEQRPGIDYRGIWAEQTLYGEGQFVTHGGSMWHAKSASISRRPGSDPSAWVLVVKRGNDGRDAPQT